MSAEIDAHLDAGNRALAAGDWAVAREPFEAALAHDDDARVSITDEYRLLLART